MNSLRTYFLIKISHVSYKIIFNIISKPVFKGNQCRTLFAPGYKLEGLSFSLR
jgi:hypothetical protein